MEPPQKSFAGLRYFPDFIILRKKSINYHHLISGTAKGERLLSHSIILTVSPMPARIFFAH